VITNAVNIAAELAGISIEVILTGGILRENSFSLVGPLAEETLGRLSADIFFLAVDGFDVHYGPTTPNLLEAKVNREMIKISGRTVCVRLQQIRAPQSFPNRRAFLHSPGNYRQQDYQGRFKRAHGGRD
jgi:DeoR/GlpR family transcriptional regulator of sugar metabolism